MEIRDLNYLCNIFKRLNDVCMCMLGWDWKKMANIYVAVVNINTMAMENHCLGFYIMC